MSNTTTERPGLVFDEAFFANYGQEVDLAAQAQVALGNILTVQSEDGTARSYEQIKAEAEAFFANETVQQDMRLLDSLSMQYAMFCASHNHASEMMNSGSLQDVFNRGNNAEHAHNHEKSANHDEDEDEHKTKKKKLGWFSLFQAS